MTMDIGIKGVKLIIHHKVLLFILSRIYKKITILKTNIKNNVSNVIHKPVHRDTSIHSQRNTI